MSIRHHPLWSEIKPFVCVQIVRPDGGWVRPRFRLEFKAGITSDMKARWTAITVPCVRCGDPVHPIRARLPGGRAGPLGNLYLAPACTLQANISCSRGKAVHTEYLKIREDIENIPA